MKHNCASCSAEFSAKTSRATYCSDRCRKRAQRGQITAPVVRLPVMPRSGTLADTVEATLDYAGRAGTPGGQLCIILARRIDDGAESATGLAALSRELTARLDHALAGADAQGDIVDELRAKRAARGAV